MKKIIYELTKASKTKEVTMHARISRLLVGFFVGMIILTFISRAADYVIVAKVDAAKVKSGKLSFIIDGTGFLEADTQQYVELYAGVRIEDIAVKAGQQIKEGDVLFCYNMEDLKEKQADLEDELKKEEISEQISELSNGVYNYESGVSDAELALDRTEEDLRAYKSELVAAEARINEEKKTAYEEAQQYYNDMADAYMDMEDQKNNAVKNAQEDIDEAQTVLAELNKGKTDAENAISTYNAVIKNASPITDEEEISGSMDSAAGITDNIIGSDFWYIYQNIDNEFITIFNNIILPEPAAGDANITAANNTSASDITEDPVLNAIQDIFILYYGKEGYEGHLKEVAAAKKCLKRAEEDYVLAVMDLPGAYTNMTQKLNYIRIYEDAVEALNEIVKKDTELYAAILSYGRAVQSDAPDDIKRTYEDLFVLLYQEDDITKKIIKNAEKALTAATEALDDITQDWDKSLTREADKVNKAQTELEKAKKICDQIQDGSYDYSEGAKQEMNQIKSSERAIEDARIGLGKAISNDAKTSDSKDKHEELEALNKELYEMNCEDINKNILKLGDILKNNGEIKAPAGGILTDIGIKEGRAVTGAEQVSISVGSLRFKTKIEKKSTDRLSIGDSISILAENSMDEIIISIDSIGFEDANGMIEITGTMPESNYSAGTFVNYRIVKQSQNYQQTIPIQALRQNNNIFYVLVAEERNTVLGDEFIAVKREISLLNKDFTKAAIQETLSSKDLVITSSNKAIKEGDRVRIND